MPHQCNVAGCDRPMTPHAARGFCISHYKRWLKDGNPHPEIPFGSLRPPQKERARASTLKRREQPGAKCAVSACDSVAVTMGWCNIHYQRWHRWGDPLHPYMPNGAQCTVDGCERPGQGRTGLCRTHHWRLRNIGDVQVNVPIRAPGKPLPERFWKRVTKTETCWLWTGAPANSGYGSINKSGRHTPELTHRLAWMLATGQPIPPGMQVLHTCDVRLCVRNDEPGVYVVGGIERPRWGHLFLGTPNDNVVDMFLKGRAPKRGRPGNPALGDKNGAHTHPERRPLGSANGAAKLTEDMVRQVRELYATGGVTMKSLAARFGVERTTLASAIHHKTWRHI